MIDLSAFNPQSKKYKKNELRSIADFSSDKFELATSSVYSAMKNELEALADKESVLQDEISNYSENNGGIPTSKDIEIIDKILAATSDTYWTTESNCNIRNENNLPFQKSGDYNKIIN